MPAEDFSCPSSFAVEKNVLPGDIAGSYRKHSDWAPAKLAAEGEASGYDYLGITPIEGNLVRIQLATIERNGHDCRIDSYAFICGAHVVIRPAQEDLEILRQREMGLPTLLVTADHISFAENPAGGFTSGAPYCGTMGYLRHAFPRSSRKTSF